MKFVEKREEAKESSKTFGDLDIGQTFRFFTNDCLYMKTRNESDEISCVSFDGEIYNIEYNKDFDNESEVIEVDARILLPKE